MKKIITRLSALLISVNILTGCNPVKEVSSITSNKSSVKTPEDFLNAKLTLNPDEDISSYKQSLMPIADLPKLEEYLNGLINHIIDANKLDAVFINKRPKVVVSVDASFNAVTLKNGLIVVNTGMLAQLETEAELQAVLAHELTHLLNEDHDKDSLQKVTDKTLKLGMAQLNQKYANASKSVLLSQGLTDLLAQQLLDDVLNTLAFTKWNREQEIDADIAGTYLLHGAGINEKYMLKFLNKRKDFEMNNQNIFASQNNEDSKILDTFNKMLSGLVDLKKESEPDSSVQSTAENQVEPSDSITGKYYTANTRYQAVKDILISNIGKEKINSTVKTKPLKEVMPQYKKIIQLYNLRRINIILKDKNMSAYKRFTTARDMVKSARKGGLENNSYLNLLLASVYESRRTAKQFAPKYRSLALKDPNATLSVYANVISYYDKSYDKNRVLTLLDKLNKEMDYPNAFLAQTLKYQKKYGESTEMTEAQCIRTIDLRVYQGCTLALGRDLDTGAVTMLKAFEQNETNQDEVAEKTIPENNSILPNSLSKLLPL